MALKNDNESGGSGEKFRRWLSTMWPIVIAVILFIATYVKSNESQDAGGAMRQAAITDIKLSIDRIEHQINGVSTKQIDMAISIAELKKDIEYIKGGSLKRYERSEFPATPGAK